MGYQIAQYTLQFDAVPEGVSAEVFEALVYMYVHGYRFLCMYKWSSDISISGRHLDRDVYVNPKYIYI